MKTLPKPDGTTEQRIVTTKIEVRANGDGDDAPPVLVGYAAVFGELSENLGGFREQIAPGAFSKSVGGDIRALFNHDRGFVLGRTKSKTLAIREDQRGLYVEITPPNTAMARSVLESVRRGDIDQMSFSFRTIRDEWAEGDDNIWLRTLREVELIEVSPVAFPAYPQTDIAVRSLEAFKETLAPDFSALNQNELRKLDLLDVS